MKIKRLENKYIEDLMYLYNQLLPGSNLLYNNKIESLFNFVRDSDYYYILIGIKNGIVITTCTLIIIPNMTHEQRPYAIIENVVTHKDYRKRGYGSQVIKYAIEVAKEKNCHKILLQTRRKDKSILDFYKKMGFKDNMTTGFMIDLEMEY